MHVLLVSCIHYSMQITKMKSIPVTLSVCCSRLDYASFDDLVHYDVVFSTASLSISPRPFHGSDVCHIPHAIELNASLPVRLSMDFSQEARYSDRLHALSAQPWNAEPDIKEFIKYQYTPDELVYSRNHCT